MSKVGGLTTKFYAETKGMKVSGGQKVKSGTVLTREGDKWKPGVNVIGMIHLTAACDGEVYFTRKRGKRKKAVTYIHVKPLGEAKGTKATKKKVVKKTATSSKKEEMKKKAETKES